MTPRKPTEPVAGTGAKAGKDFLTSRVSDLQGHLWTTRDAVEQRMGDLNRRPVERDTADSPSVLMMAS
jgi:hypothetical protein